MEVVMRLYFNNVTRQKKAAKIFAALTGQTLSFCQRAIARSCGYRDWHDLESSVRSEQPSECDEYLPRDAFIETQVSLISQLKVEFSMNSGDIQHALSASRITGNRRADISEQLDIRIRVFQNEELPAVTGKVRGAIGKLKTSGRNGEPVILKNFGPPVHVITHGSGNAGVADFEYVTPRKPLPLFIPMRLYLAYGAWIEDEGATVLFSRDYCPLWRIREGQRAERLEPWNRIRFVHQSWFWDDRNTPWSDPELCKKEMNRLSDYGLIGLPLLVEILPIVVHGDDVNFTDAVGFLRSARKNQRAA